MDKFRVGDTVYHRLMNESDGFFGTIVEIDGNRAKLRWEDNYQVDSVEIRDLLTEVQARRGRLL